MSRPKTQRNGAVLRRRGGGISQRELARRFGVSRRTIRDLLESSGDPLFEKFLAEASEHLLNRKRARLLERIAAARRELEAVEQELEVRRNDRLLGLKP